MAKVKAKIPVRYRMLLFTGILLSWGSGFGYYIMQRWVLVESDFGLTNHPFQATLREIHGAAAFLMMIFYGYLLASHVPSGWKQNRLRLLGLALLGSLFLLMFTGYLIYYASNEKLLEVVKLTHLIVGITFPLILIAHIISATLTKPRKSKKTSTN